MYHSRGMFYYKPNPGEKRDKTNNKIGGQNSLSPEPQTSFAKGAKMNASMITVCFIAVMVIVFATIGFVAMWRERHWK